MLSIRFYTQSDYKAVKTILIEGGLYVKEWETPKKLLRKITKDPESILIAEFDHKPVGCLFIVDDGWNAFLWRLSVVNQYRNQGVGTALIAKAVEIIKSRGHDETSLFVDPSNLELIKWYKNQGFKATRDYTFMFKVL